MRLYSFVNYYLSPLQHGLQTAHCVADMAFNVSRGDDDELYEKFCEWAEHHKTIIICNGGNCLTLEELFEQLVRFGESFNLPVTKFYEDMQSLNTALTSVAILVPEELYDTKFIPSELVPTLELLTLNSYVHEPVDRPGLKYDEGSEEYEFIKLLKSFRLA